MFEVPAAGALFLSAASAAPDAPASAPRLDAWNVIGPGGGGRQMCLAVSPIDPGTAVLRCDMGGSYLTRDGGKRWRMFHLGSGPAFFVFDPNNANVIYAKGVGLFQSRDGGKTWRLLHPDPSSLAGVGMPAENGGLHLIVRGAPPPHITALAVDPADSRLLYAGMSDGPGAALWTSRDMGKTWSKSAQLPSGAERIYIDPASDKADRRLYVLGEKGMAVRKAGKWVQAKETPWAGALEDVSAGFVKGAPTPVIYVMTADTIWISSDAGASWRKSRHIARKDDEVYRDPRKRPDGFYGISACLHRPEVAYVSYAEFNRGNRVWGVARTGDTGGTWDLRWKESHDNPMPTTDDWVERRFPFRSREPMEVQVAATNPDICYGTGRSRTVVTTDGGKTWKAVYSRQIAGGGYTTTGLDVMTCYGVHFDPFDRRRMFITYTDVGLFRSEDGGVSWHPSTEGVPRQWVNTTYWVEFDPTVKGRMWGVMTGVHDLPRVKMWRGSPPGGKGKVKWGQYTGGVCRSEDGGRTWTVTNQGMSDTPVTHILMDPVSNPGARVFYVAGFGRGVFKSVDDGRTWSLKNNGIHGDEPFAWRLSRDRNGTLYLVVARRSDDGGFGNEGDGALYRSRDGAENWERIQLPRGVNGPNGLAIDTQDPRRLYLATWGRSGNQEAVDGGIFLSEDAGRSWRNVLSRDQHVYDISVDPKHPGTLYACGFESTAWRSADRGLNWSRIRGYNFKMGHRVIPDPYNEKMIYITTFGGSVWYGPAVGDPAAREDVFTPGFMRS